MVSKTEDAYGREISKETKAKIRSPILDPDKDPIDIFRSFQIRNELGKASSFARKQLSQKYSEEFLDLVKNRLKLRGLSTESMEIALLSLQKSLRR